MELVLPNDALVLAVDWLRTNLDTEAGYTDLHVGSTIPTDRPATFVVVTLTGGSLRDRVVDQAVVTVDSWAATHPAALDLAQWCRALMMATAGRVLDGHQIYRVDEFAGPALLPDDVSDQPRYRASYQLSVRCTVIA